jgi:hypothetical protein
VAFAAVAFAPDRAGGALRGRIRRPSR